MSRHPTSVDKFTRDFPELRRRLELYLASLPPGADPMSYGFDRVNRLLNRMAIFPMLSLPDTGQANTPIMEGNQLIGVEIQEGLHRFLMKTRPPKGSSELENVISKRRVANAQVRWHLAPDGYSGGPGQVPPPTPFRPNVSQRCVMEGRFTFDDDENSGLDGFATGRTFPTTVGEKQEIRLAAMVEVLEGFGGLRGQVGQVGINGIIEPPEIMRLAVVPSFSDFHGHLCTRHPITSLPSLPDPVANELFFLVKGGIDPQDPMRIVPCPHGLLTAPADLPLHLLEIDFQSTPRLVSHSGEGAPIGFFHTDFWIGPIDSGPSTPFQSVNSFYSFRDLEGRRLGELQADTLEGRASRVTLPGLRTPAYQFAGIGPIDGGEGLFEGATGFITTVGVMTVFPRAMSVMYILRLVDPDGQYRDATHRAWGGKPQPREAAPS